MLSALWQQCRICVEANEIHCPRDDKCSIHGRMLPILYVALLEAPCLRIVHSPACRGADCYSEQAVALGAGKFVKLAGLSSPALCDQRQATAD